MLVKVLIDNLARDGLLCEWGLSLWIEYDGRRILLDAGTSGAFADNARRMGVSLSEADAAVLSHAHYDHANGLDRFFAENEGAKVYIARAARENCYSWKKALPKYNGIRRGMLRQHAHRFVRAQDRQEILPGVHLLAHSAPYFAEMGRFNKLYVRRGLWLHPDDFRHEQSLVFDTDTGLVVFNSCSHAGPDVIIREAEQAFPGKKVRALIGGFHLFRLCDDEVRALAGRLKKCGVEKLVTGHCSGQRGFEVLHEELGDRVQQMYTGMTIEI